MDVTSKKEIQKVVGKFEAGNIGGRLNPHNVMTLLLVPKVVQKLEEKDSGPKRGKCPRSESCDFRQRITSKLRMFQIW